jgi:hypothetical protein
VGLGSNLNCVGVTRDRAATFGSVWAVHIFWQTKTGANQSTRVKHKDTTTEDRIEFEAGDPVVVCRGQWIGKTGWVTTVVTLGFLRIALNIGVLVLVQRENVCLIVDGESSDLDGWEPTEILDEDGVESVE